MEAVSKHDFQATADDELSFKKGSILKVKRIPADVDSILATAGPDSANTEGFGLRMFHFNTLYL